MARTWRLPALRKWLSSTLSRALSPRRAAPSLCWIRRLPAIHCCCWMQRAFYHRQMTRQLAESMAGRLVTPLMRLQDPAYTRVILVTLPKTRPPVSEAAALQTDLRRARIEPYGWVINKSLAATGTRDPMLRQRIARERLQIDRVRSGLAKRAYILGLRAKLPVGLDDLSALS